MFDLTVKIIDDTIQELLIDLKENINTYNVAEVNCSIEKIKLLSQARESYIKSENK